MGKIDWVFVAVLTVLVLLLVGAFAGYSRNFQACLEDGYKQWECSAMLNGGGRVK